MWMFHSDGRLPYFPWYTNTLIQFVYKVYRKVGMTIGIIKGNQGPWGEWKVVVNSDQWEKAIQENHNAFQQISSAFTRNDIENLLRDDNIEYFERVNLMQTLYQLQKNNQGVEFEENEKRKSI